jgi:protein subunit release factor B
MNLFQVNAEVKGGRNISLILEGENNFGLLEVQKGEEGIGLIWSPFKHNCILKVTQNSLLIVNVVVKLLH